jgi:Tfp pilus assembly protein PilF
VRAHVALAASLLAQRRPADAEAACRAALDVDPETAKAHYLLWDALEVQGKRVELEQARRAAPGLTER